MVMTMKDLVGLAGVAFLIGLVQWVKQANPDLPKNWYPAIAMAIALAINVAAALLVPFPVADGVIQGLVAGLGACGLYSATKAAAGLS